MAKSWEDRWLDALADNNDVDEAIKKVAEQAAARAIEFSDEFDDDDWEDLANDIEEAAETIRNELSQMQDRMYDLDKAEKAKR